MKNFYNFDQKARYLEKLDTIKHKKFYAAHPVKYMGDVRPVGEDERAVNGLFSPLHKTGFTT